jgi:hypothetical protein
MAILKPLLVITVIVGALALTSGSASAADDLTCNGGVIAPGTYQSINVNGSCSIPAGPVEVLGNIFVNSGGVLDAAHDADLTVHGVILVFQGGALMLGCTPEVGCDTPPDVHVHGSVIAIFPLAVLIHGVTVDGTVLITGGSGGVNCDLHAELGGGPAYVTVEDSTVGNVIINGYQGCWLGTFRNWVAGSIIIQGNQLAHPDATEVTDNNVAGSLICLGNSPQAQVGDSMGGPNIVTGAKIGECSVL